MKDLFIGIGYLIFFLYYITHILSHPDLKLGKFGARNLGYNNWLLTIFLCFITLELTLLMIYLLILY